MAAGYAAQRGRSGLATWALMFGIWLMASGSLDPASAVTGLVVTGLIAWVSAMRGPFWVGLDLKPARIGAFLRYLLRFLREMVQSNLAMLGYVYAPRLQLAPKVISVPTRLTGPRERLTLTSTIALTPGSLVLALDGPELAVHILDDRLEDGIRDSIAGFEPLLETALG